MPHVEIDGIRTAYEVIGSGPPLLMFSPGGFNAVRNNWSELGVYKRLSLLPALSERFRCIVFDRREAGESGGRVQRLDWRDLVAQGIGLLDRLGISRAHLMGGCVGCSIVARASVDHPSRVAGMVLYSPAGGPRYRMGQHRRFVQHLAFAAFEGLDGVVDHARATTESFSQDPRVGPWASVLRSDEEFAAAYRGLDPAWYEAVVTGTARVMFDRDTVPGVEPEDLLSLEDVPTLIVPGDDASHAPSAAQYLRECLPAARYWDAPVAEQTSTSAPQQILAALDEAQARRPADA
ncbi:alpha/beta fold hydrolase [Egicoccus sp. AB-alg2]|uniref:alpha/beta fold hydrolase n=1 Tax=Egicoccus sp. AB-alg2 TaxID=3242693 RepID=UPI00359E545F